VIPPKIKIISSYAFSECEELTKVVILGSNLEIIEKGAFCGCENLVQINIPHSVRYIDKMAFCECRNLQSIEIPPCMTKVSDSCFYGCKNLRYADLRNIIDIEQRAFECCESLEEIILPDCFGIESFAFDACKSLKKIHMLCKDPHYSISYSGRNFFDDSIFDQCTLFVLPGTRSDYTNDKYFGKFKNIEIEDNLELLNNKPE
jgi:hypothetical protein